MMTAPERNLNDGPMNTSINTPTNTPTKMPSKKKFPIIKILIIAGILILVPVILYVVFVVIVLSHKVNPNLTYKTYGSFELYYPKYFKEMPGNTGRIVLKDPEKNVFGGQSTIVFSDVSESNIDISTESKCLQEIEKLKTQTDNSELKVEYLENVLSPQFRDRTADFTCRVDMKISVNGVVLNGETKLFYDKRNNKTYDLVITYAEKENKEKITDITDAFIESSVTRK